LEVQQVFQAVVDLLEKYVMFIDAYPDCSPHCRFPWAQELLIQAACVVNFDMIGICLHHNTVYAKVIADAVRFTVIHMYIYLINFFSLKLASVYFKIRSNRLLLLALRACILFLAKTHLPELSTFFSINSISTLATLR
jgi:hypothetical protein